MNFLSLLGGLAVPCIVCFVIGLVLLIVEITGVIREDSIPITSATN